MSPPPGPAAPTAAPPSPRPPTPAVPAAAKGIAPERAAYVFIEPLIVGRLVLDVAPAVAGSADLLKAAGAKSVSVVPGGPKLEVPDGAFEVVLCLGKLSDAADDVMRHRWLAELARVLHPGGCCVVRVGSAAGFRGKDAPKDGPAGLSRAALDDLLHFHFTTVDIVAEARFGGVGFSVPGVDAVAVNEEVLNLAESASHHLAFCGKGRERTWALRESLWVPIRGLSAAALAGTTPQVPATPVEQELARVRARYHEVCIERDNLRETMMTSQDRGDQREERLSALRREAERHLQQISDDAGALELAELDRERAERKAAETEKAIAALNAQLREREADILTLETELGRFKTGVRRAPSGT